MAIDARKHDGQVDVAITLLLGAVALPVACIVTVEPHGLTIRPKGRRQSLRIDWTTLAARMTPPVTAKAKYLANPLGLLTDG
jgi:hypothetical protein